MSNWNGGPTYVGSMHDSAIWQELSDELDRAMHKHPPIHSAHEGWSVILEELEELRDHVRSDAGRTPQARREAIQVAAMALRYVFDLIDAPAYQDGAR